MSFTAAQIAEQLKGEVVGDGASANGICARRFCAGRRPDVCREGKSFRRGGTKPGGGHSCIGCVYAAKKVLIRVKDARVAMARVLPVFFPPEKMPSGIHPAVIDASAHVGPTAHIGPNCVLGARAVGRGRC